MRSTKPFRRWRHLRTQIVWCLLVAIPFGGLSSTLVELLGSYHFHRQARASIATLSNWQDFRRVDHAYATGRPAPGHSALHRHHHSPSDPTVASMGGGSGDGIVGDASSSFYGSPLVWALGGQIEIRPPVGNTLEWPRRDAGSLMSRATDPLERPPRA